MQSSKKSNRQRKFLFGLLTLSGILLIVLLIFLNIRKKSKTDPSVSLPHKNRVSGSRIFDLIGYLRWRPYATWIEAMARHESGNFTNTLSKNYNNIFSMGFPKFRMNVATPSGFYTEGQQMARYDSWDLAIEDLMLWFVYKDFRTDITTVGLFVQELKINGYFTDSVDNYLNGVKRWL